MRGGGIALLVIALVYVVCVVGLRDEEKGRQTQRGRQGGRSLWLPLILWVKRRCRGELEGEDWMVSIRGVVG
jgi:hypothetical protein